MGTLPETGLGFDETPAKEVNSPSNATLLPLHRVRMTSTYSSVRAPRRFQGIPRASNSSRSHPTPMPRSTRPPVSWSMVASCLASTSGLRSGRIRMPVASRMVEVWAPTQVSQVRGSVRSVSGAIIIRPESSYG